MNPHEAIQIEAQGTSESLEQIKLISRAIQRGQTSSVTADLVTAYDCVGNYSPQQQKGLETSSSLQDFSQAEIEEQKTFNDYKG